MDLIKKLSKSVRNDLCDKVYLNTGSSGLVPYEYMKGINEYRSLLFPDGPGAFFTTGKHLDDFVEELRKELAEFTGCKTTELAFTLNTTDGISRILNSIKWNSGDEIIVSECEYFSLMLNCIRISKQKNIVLKLLKTDKNGDFDPEEMISMMNKKTKLAVFSHVNYQNGRINPVAYICSEAKKRKVLTLVDGAQAIGQLKFSLNSLGCDFYPFPAHKWLCAEEGAGAMYISESVIESLDPVDIGYFSVKGYNPPDEYTFVEGAKRFECASYPYLCLAVFKKALYYTNLIGIDKIREEILAKTEYVLKKLSKINGIEILSPLNPEEGSGLISIKVKDCCNLVNTLEKEYKIISRTIPTPNCARFSFHYFTSKKEIEIFLKAIKEIM